MKAYVGLGSNLGDREAQIRTALEQLAQLPGTQLVRASSLYDTEPVGDLEQPNFLNAVAGLRDRARAAASLLWNLLLIERRLGRVRSRPPLRGPRTIDLDLLFHGDTVLIDEPELHAAAPRDRAPLVRARAAGRARSALRAPGARDLGLGVCSTARPAACHASHEQALD